MRINRGTTFLILTHLFLTPITANASVWDAIGACFTDPCNCGDSNSTRWEDWNNQHINKGQKNRNCPPWNKTDGRNDHTCLVKAGFPGAWIGYYENICGEETSDSTYLSPKIRVRGQQCNAFACWSTTDTLDWDGECVTLASGYGLPLLRMCARIAIPADYKENFPQDPGYTPKKHLNFEGANVDDDVILGYDNQPIDFNPPKLCLYKDPAFLSFTDGFDIMDLNPYKQSAHKISETHPVVKVIIFFAEIASQTSQTPLQLLSTLFDQMNNGDEGQTTFFTVMSDLFQYIGWIIEQIGDAIITLLEEIGQINRAVDSTSYGCVNLPMGPYPPPCCPTIAPFFQTAYTQKICRKDSGGVPLPSTGDEPCVVSTLNNNLIKNSVRITFENFVPLCGNGQLPNTDKCVAINNLNLAGTPSALHTLTGKTDVLPLCSNAPSGSVCVNTTIPHTCSVPANGCQSGFRVVYGVKVGSTVSPGLYFRDDLQDCPTNNAVACQQIWGINTSEFVDISLTFPTIQSTPDLTPLQTSTSLTDKNGNVVNFSVSIVRTPTFDSALGFMQDPKQICVTQNDIVVGCENRAPFTKPIVYDCSNSLAPVSCTSTYFQPKLVASITSGGDITSAVVEPLSAYNTSNVSNQINLAGYNFSSFVTDDSFVKKPFSGTSSPNPTTLYGTYQNNALPLNPDHSVNTYAVYLYGLEYINDQYHLGGKYSCLENIDINKCPNNTSICVLTNLQNRNIVNCNDFINKLPNYNGLGLCNSTQAGTCTTIVDSLPGSSGGISIRSCGNSVYCYTDQANVEVCKISNLASDRYLPSASLGSVLSDSQYYDINNTSPGYNYDKSLYALRDKTSYEMNLCTTIPQPKCAATNTYSQDDGYAAWPETTVGDIATGTCNSGGVALAPLQRRCIPNPDTQTFEFEPLYTWDLSGSTPVKVYGNVQCTYIDPNWWLNWWNNWWFNFNFNFNFNFGF